jgi:hypothetical protein
VVDGDTYHGVAALTCLSGRQAGVPTSLRKFGIKTINLMYKSNTMSVAEMKIEAINQMTRLIDESSVKRNFRTSFKIK